MTETNGSSSECRRLWRAVREGDYVRDPTPWKAHVETCDDCRRTVGGLEAIRTLLLDGDEDFRPDEKVPPSEGWAVAALRRVNRERRRRRLAIVVAVVVVAILVFAVIAWGGTTPHSDHVLRVQGLRQHATADPSGLDSDHVDDAQWRWQRAENSDVGPEQLAVDRSERRRRR